MCSIQRVQRFGLQRFWYVCSTSTCTHAQTPCHAHMHTYKCAAYSGFSGSGYSGSGMCVDIHACSLSHTHTPPMTRPLYTPYLPQTHPLTHPHTHAPKHACSTRACIHTPRTRMYRIHRFWLQRFRSNWGCLREPRDQKRGFLRRHQSRRFLFL